MSIYRASRCSLKKPKRDTVTAVGRCSGMAEISQQAAQSSNRKAAAAARNCMPWMELATPPPAVKAPPDLFF
jgi:hypothetical protein